MKEKIVFLEELMELDEGSLQEDMILDELEEWDSLTRLALMAECKERYEVYLTADQIRSCVTIKDLCNIIN